MPDLIKLRAANEARWSAMRVTGAVTAIDATARRLVAAPAKMRYFQVSQSTGVPWFVIAVIHEREASQDWTRNIAQGDPWDRTSIHVPKGRGPFRSWSDAAVDALSFCAPYAARNKDWSAGGTLTLLESYNGLGYANKGIPSPYIWASTDQYVKGKYVADGVFDANAVDKQIGCAALLKRMAMLDASVNFGAQPSVPPVPTPAPVQKPVQPTKPKKKAAAAVVVAAGAATTAHASGLPAGDFVAAGIIIAAVVLAAVLFRK